MLQKLPETLTWFFKDPKFASILIKLSLLVLSCVLVLPMIYVIPLLVGYQIRVARHLQGNLFELPEIDTQMWLDGLVYLLVVGGISVIVSLVFLGIPTIITVFAGIETQGVLYWSLYIFTTILQNIVPFVLGLWGFFAMSIFARTRTIGDIFSVLEYRNMWELNKWNMFIAFVLNLVIPNFVLGVGLMLLCIGIIPATVVVVMMAGSLVSTIEY